MIGLMMLTFLFLITFVVNTGLLINAKINLQNAADLAAYAGAATQARQLNRISYLNYEMRRQYKKFLFRYYVVGNMAQDGFPGSGSGERQWSPDGTSANDYQVPAVCVIYDEGDNFCSLTNLRAISIPPPTPLAIIGNALRNQLQQFENIRLANCQEAAALNEVILSLWLFNTDPTTREITRALAGAAGVSGSNARRRLQTIRGLVQGLGLIPRQAILLSRIKTLEEYVNFAPQTGVTLETIQELESSAQSPIAERTILAFKSAFETLGEHTFPAGSITLDELLPSGTDGANLLNLKTLTTGFEAYAVKYDTGLSGSSGTDGCIGQPTPLQLVDAPMGVAKNPSILTYYPIRLKATAQLLFSPFGPITLKAYSAAYPFGSRIGPDLPPEQFRKEGQRLRLSAGPLNCGGSPCLGVPNLLISSPSEGGAALSWYNSNVLREYYGQLTAGPGSGPIGTRALELAYHAAMTPTPSERGVYNIINDQGVAPDDPLHIDSGDPHVRFFADDLTHRFYAPILPDNVPEEEIRDEVNRLFESVIKDATLRSALLESFLAYINTLRNGEGENGESFQIAVLEDPLRRIPPGGNQPETVSLSPEVMIRSQADLNTSWSGVKNRQIANQGRVGYSVKYISFRALQGQEFTTDGRTTWENGLGGDAEASGDIPFLTH